MPVILERSEKAVGNIVMKKYGKEWRIQAKVARFKCSDLCTQTCPYRLARLGTSLRVRGEADIKEERNYSFYYFYMSQTKEYWNDSYQKVVLTDLSQRERMQTVSRPRMTGSKRTAFRGAERRCKSEWDALPWLRWRRSRRKGQVWAEPKNSFLQNCINTCPSFLNGRKKRSGISLWKSTGKSEESRQRLQDLNVLTCVRRLAPIASQGSALPSAFGGKLTLRKKEIIVFIIFIWVKPKNTEMTRTKKLFLLI